MAKFTTEYDKASLNTALSVAANAAEEIDDQLRQVAKGRVTKKPCVGCPYRKDKDNWLNEAATLCNVTMIHHGFAQTCHMSVKSGDPSKRRVCCGALRCLEGGDEQIVSPNELAMREPKESFEAALEQYTKNVPTRKSKKP